MLGSQSLEPYTLIVEYMNGFRTKSNSRGGNMTEHFTTFVQKQYTNAFNQRNIRYCSFRQVFHYLRPVLIVENRTMYKDTNKLT